MLAYECSVLDCLFAFYPIFPITALVPEILDLSERKLGILLCLVNPSLGHPDIFPFLWMENWASRENWASSGYFSIHWSIGFPIGFLVTHSRNFNIRCWHTVRMRDICAFHRASLFEYLPFNKKTITFILLPVLQSEFSCYIRAVTHWRTCRFLRNVAEETLSYD